MVSHHNWEFVRLHKSPITSEWANESQHWDSCMCNDNIQHKVTIRSQSPKYDENYRYMGKEQMTPLVSKPRVVSFSSATLPKAKQKSYYLSKGPQQVKVFVCQNQMTKVPSQDPQSGGQRTHSIGLSWTFTHTPRHTHVRTHTRTHNRLKLIKFLKSVFKNCRRGFLLCTAPIPRPQGHKHLVSSPTTMLSSKVSKNSDACSLLMPTC